jgi:hypothetical protein
VPIWAAEKFTRAQDRLMNELLSSRRRLGVALLASSLIALTAAGSALTASLENGGPVDLSTEFDARFHGAASSDGAGHAVSSAGDFNNDGTEDMIVGARAANRAYIVFGGPGLGTVGLGALGAGGVTIAGEAGGALGTRWPRRETSKTTASTM